MLHIVRGLPGSGKTTFAKSLNVLHVEADMYHMEGGEYNWKPENLKIAHLGCKTVTATALALGFEVVVSNTFTTLREMKPYFELTNNYQIYCCKGEYGSIHGVPDEVLQKMKNRFATIQGEIYV